eukprot:TRINITY_DN6521_c0_g1_i2.p1 TRINITY_DN6521_c0_g1~~TRINITY_DN6521_c0_g1_i2.p1  ORF type:complete len:293 (-),score=31.18 TRINITY_DN6521_c0_g1_i2:244-1122(-)
MMDGAFLCLLLFANVLANIDPKPVHEYPLPSEPYAVTCTGKHCVVLSNGNDVSSISFMFTQIDTETRTINPHTLSFPWCVAQEFYKIDDNRLLMVCGTLITHGNLGTYFFEITMVPFGISRTFQSDTYQQFYRSKSVLSPAGNLYSIGITSIKDKNTRSIYRFNALKWELSLVLFNVSDQVGSGYAAAFDGDEAIIINDWRSVSRIGFDGSFKRINGTEKDYYEVVQNLPNLPHQALVADLDPMANKIVIQLWDLKDLKPTQTWTGPIDNGGSAYMVISPKYIFFSRSDHLR